MLGPVLDVFRLRQYFDVIVRTRDLIEGVRDDAGLLDDVRRALVSLPGDTWPEPISPFPPFRPIEAPAGSGTAGRVALCATGGSGALASVVGVARVRGAGDPTVAHLAVLGVGALRLPDRGRDLR